MTDIGDAIGTAAEGTLVASAVEREKPTALKNGHFAEGACLNCGTELLGAHCHSCGQKAHLHRTLRAFMHDLLHGALHFEGKTWRTLPKLIFKPGELTRRYIDGERARFVSPMALFLFVIFLMFAVFQFAGISAPTDLRGDASDEISDLVTVEYQRIETRLETVKSRLNQETLTAEERAELEREQAELQAQITGILQAQEQVPFLDGIGEGDRPVPTAEGETVIPLTEDGTAQMTTETSGVAWIDEGVAKWRKDPSLMLYKLQTNFYKFSWLLIPLSVPFVWLLFVWKRRFKAYDHAIFVTYSLSFMTLLILVMTLVGLSGAATPLIVLPLVFIPPLHIYKHLRGAYGLSRFSAFWRLLILSAFIIIVLALFLQLLLLIGIF